MLQPSHFIAEIPGIRGRSRFCEPGRYSTNPCISSGYRVLVAEDDDALRCLLSNLFAFEGYFVTEAEDGQSLLDAVQSPRITCELAFDLIVTDVRMPGMTGLAALRELRHAGCHTPTIIISALPGLPLQQQAESLDALFLPKPFALENLRRIANRVLAETGASGSEPS